jgi:hypothetical protein
MALSPFFLSLVKAGTSTSCSWRRSADRQTRPLKDEGQPVFVAVAGLIVIWHPARQFLR